MERVQVEIFGQAYSLKGTEDPIHVRELAAFVDRKMKEIEKATGTVDPLRVAILTALTISDELHVLQQQYAQIASLTESATRRMLDLTENTDPAQK